MDLKPGQPLLGQKVDVVFLGCCTNSRISDLRLAAGLIKGRKVAGNVRMMVVPGSQQVKLQAEAEGPGQNLHRSGRRLAGVRLLDVHCHERRPVGAGPVHRQHQQPQF